MKKAYVVLENKMIYEGLSFGADKPIVGELVFTTNMEGYLETLTDPSYYGQIVIQTFPMIGNYGVIKSDFESDKIALSGYIVREYCQNPSNFRCEGDLDSLLKEYDIPGVYDIDTRSLTKVIREKGVMNAQIVYDLKDVKDISDFKIMDALSNVTRKSVTKSEIEGKYKVALFDYGVKENICRELEKRDCQVYIVPAKTSAKEILDLNVDGIMLSNGPGDPADNVFEINTIKELYGKKPIFGICLGHQMLALSQGFKTAKLHYGHRGGNQPVTNLDTKRTYITSQNHGYAVVDSKVANARINYINANDQTVEGIVYEKKAFSVQFHPEAASGPHDTAFLFDEFVKMMGGNKNASK